MKKEMTDFHMVVVLTNSGRGRVQLLLKNLPSDIDVVLNNHATFGGSNTLLLRIHTQQESSKTAKNVLNTKYMKFKNYISIFYPEVTVKTSKEIKETDHSDNYYKPLEFENLSQFFDEPVSEKELWLIEAFEDYYEDRIFDCFTKFVNWMDGILGKESTIYCSVRDNLSHLSTDVAITKTKLKFPDIFEFEDKTIKKNAHNKGMLRDLLPDVIQKVKETYDLEFIQKKHQHNENS